MDETGSNRGSSTMSLRGKKEKVLRAHLPHWKPEAMDPSALRQVNRLDVLLERSALGRVKHVKFVEEGAPLRLHPGFVPASLNKPKDRFVFVLNEANSVVELAMSSKQAGGFVRALKGLGIIQKGQVNPTMTRPSPEPPVPPRRRPMRSPWPSQESDDRALAHLQAIRNQKRMALEAALKEEPGSTRIKSLATEVELAEADVAAFIQLRSIDR